MSHHANYTNENLPPGNSAVGHQHHPVNRMNLQRTGPIKPGLTNHNRQGLAVNNNGRAVGQGQPIAGNAVRQQRPLHTQPHVPSNATHNAYPITHHSHVRQHNQALHEGIPRSNPRELNAQEHDNYGSQRIYKSPISDNLFAHDAHDPQYVPEYQDEIMRSWRKAEYTYKVNPRYMDKQKDLNPQYREILVNWLSDVRVRFSLKLDTFFLTVSIMDRFFQYRSVDRSKLQLLGCTSMFIASKYEETYAPELNDFIIVSDRNYCRDQIITMEKIILQALDFKITVPYAHHFAERFIRALQVDVKKSRLSYLVLFIIQSSLQHFTFVKYLPSQIASAAVVLALFFLNQPKLFPRNLRDACGYQWKDLVDPIHELWMVISQTNDAYKKKLEAQALGEQPIKLLDSVYRYYSDETQGSVTKKIVPFDQETFHRMIHNV